MYKGQMQRHPLNRRAFRRAFWSSTSRMIGIVIGALVGSLIFKLAGSSLQGWTPVIVLGAIGFLLIAFAEYEKSNDQ